MTDYVVRDVDVMTGTAATGAAEAVAYADTGAHVGDVTQITSADDVVAVTGGYGIGDLFILDGSAGDFATTGSIDLSASQVLLGGGSSVEVFGLDSGTRSTFTAPGLRPTVTGDVAGAGVVFVRSESMVIGLDIENISVTDSSYGIYLDPNGGNFITGNNIVTNSSTGYGIFLDDSSVNTISGNNIATSGFEAYGVYVDGGQGNAISGNSIATTGDSGYGLILRGSDFNEIDGNDIMTVGSGASGMFLIGSYYNNIENNIIETDQIGLSLTLSNFNTGNGNSYSGSGTDCFEVASSGNMIDLCL